MNENIYLIDIYYLHADVLKSLSVRQHFASINHTTINKEHETCWWNWAREEKNGVKLLAKKEKATWADIDK